MKSVRVFIAAIALSMIASAPLAAQQKKGGMSPEQQIERIEEAVGSLTKAQKDKIQQILASSRESIRSTPKEERAGVMKKQRQDVRAVLTPEQQKKYDAAGQGGGKKKRNR